MPPLPLGLAPLASAALALLTFAAADRGAGAGALSGEKSSRQMGQEELMNWRPARAASCSRLILSSSVWHRLRGDASVSREAGCEQRTGTSSKRSTQHST